MKEDAQGGTNLPEKLPKEFDIETVDIQSEEDDVIHAGKVESWQQREISEKEKVRPYITTTVVLVWSISVVVIALKYFWTGNLLLFVPPALLTGPLYIILRFYYRSG